MRLINPPPAEPPAEPLATPHADHATPRKFGHGGARKGAGRPRKRWSPCPDCNLLQSLIAELARAAKRPGG